MSNQIAIIFFGNLQDMFKKIAIIVNTFLYTIRKLKSEVRFYTTMTIRINLKNEH